MEEIEDIEEVSDEKGGNTKSKLIEFGIYYYCFSILNHCILFSK